MSREASKVLVLGVGGLGCPASKVLAASGVGELVFVDDDVVSVSNLHRQVLFEDKDVGKSKVEVAARRLRGLGASVRPKKTRFLPENSHELLEGVDLIVEGADNLATKFLACDAAQLGGIPIVQAGAVRWGGWAFASTPGDLAHRPCLRCLFEDIPAGDVQSCEFAGVVGPVVGALGALQALLALRILDGLEDVGGTLYRLDGLRPSLRQTTLRPRPGCPHGRRAIQTLERSRYTNRTAESRPRETIKNMSIEIRIPPALRSFTGGNDEVVVEGPSVRDALDSLENAHPGIKERICGPDGKVLRFVNLFVGEEDIRMLDGLDTVVGNGETLSIIPAMAGGS